MHTKYFKPVFKGIKKPFKILKVYLKQRLGWLDVPKILPYRGFGNETDVFISGMVIEDKGLAKPKDSQKFWKNLIATIKRFSSDEIPQVKIRAEFLGHAQTAETDELGFFSFRFHVPDKTKELQTKKWHTVHFELLDQIVEEQPQIHATGEVRIIKPAQQRIIVSDIDDTVMISHSTQTFRKLRLMLFKNALTRIPFPGVTIFYKALAAGKSEQDDNPFFFVSSSEWNLYDLLDDFFSFNHIPKGVLMLRKLNYSIYQFWKSGGGNHEHKYENIRSLFDFYPEQRFILIGDSGQRDPIIYSRIATEFPGRVESVYIRQIRSKSYMNGQENLPEKMAETGASYIEVKNTQEAFNHASEKGYVATASPEDVN